MPTKPGFTEKARVLFAGLKQDVGTLHAKWQLYIDLFSDSARIEIINKTVPSVFHLVEESLRDDMTMSFGRLLDPSQPGKNAKRNNVSLKSLMSEVQKMDVAFHSNMRKEYNAFCKHCKPIIEWRHRRVAHKDLRTAMKTHPNPLPGIKKSYIDRAMKTLAEIMNAIELHFDRGETRYDAVLMDGTGADLIDIYLKRALDSDEEEQRKSRGGAR